MALETDSVDIVALKVLATSLSEGHDDNPASAIEEEIHQLIAILNREFQTVRRHSGVSVRLHSQKVKASVRNGK